MGGWNQAHLWPKAGMKALYLWCGHGGQESPRCLTQPCLPCCCPTPTLRTFPLQLSSGPYLEADRWC